MVEDLLSVEMRQKTCYDPKDIYKPLDEVLTHAEFGVPIFFDETEHLTHAFENNMQRLRFFHALQLSVNIDMYRYTPGEMHTTVVVLVKVPDEPKPRAIQVGHS